MPKPHAEITLTLSEVNTLIYILQHISTSNQAVVQASLELHQALRERATIARQVA